MARPEPAQLTVRRDDAPDRTVVTVTGELDLGTAPVLRERLIEISCGERVPDLAVDTSGVTFVDSSGLAVLLMGARRWEATGRAFVLTTPSKQMRRIVELTGAQALLPIED